MILVLDSSATLSLVLLDEQTPASAELFRRIDQEGAIVPTLWRLEVANALLMAERRGRLGTVDLLAILSDLAALPINEDAETGRQAWSRTVEIARFHRLTVYDAAYVELAERLDLPLATNDKALLKAAQTLGIPLV